MKRCATSSRSRYSLRVAAPHGLRARGVRAELPIGVDQRRHASARSSPTVLTNRRPPFAGAVMLQREVRLDRRHEPVGAFAVRLVDDEDVGDFHDAGLERLHFVAGARHERHDRHVGGADDVHFVLADADGLDDDDVLAAASSTSAASPVARARPPRCPRVAMLRMNTPASPACACIRRRSPRTAPPRERAGRIDGDDADASLRRAARATQLGDRARSTSVLLPAPGGPVTPIEIGAAGVAEDRARRGRRPPASSSSIARWRARWRAGRPASTRSASGAVSGVTSRDEQLARDDEPLDLARALRRWS